MPAETGFGALGVFELHDAHPLDGLLAHAEEAGRHLGDDVVVVGLQLVGVAPFAGAAEGVQGGRGPCPGHHGEDADRAEGHAAEVERDRDGRRSVSRLRSGSAR